MTIEIRIAPLKLYPLGQRLSIYFFPDENSAKKLLNIYRRHHGANDVVIDKDLNARATLGCRTQCTHGFGHHLGKSIILGGEILEKNPGKYLSGVSNYQNFCSQLSQIQVRVHP